MISSLAQKPGPWFREPGPMSDIVISSRIRLARNVAGFPFLSKATDEQRADLARRLKNRIDAKATNGDWEYLDMEHTDDIDRQVLVERHLISRQHADLRGTRGVAISKDETVSVMVNEEDHLRIQVLRGGFSLDRIWDEINRIDDRIEEKIDYAFHPRYGYLTACPTNVGTGLRVSVMLHLPALKLTNEIERVFRAARDMHLAVRGLFGEGTEATGDFFQVSNQVTLGRTETEIIEDFKSLVVPRIVEYENRARQCMVNEKARSLDDRVWRSYGILRHARSIGSEETMQHLSNLRMGIHLGRLKNLNPAVVNDLFLITRPAHLQKIHGGQLSGDQRAGVRADLIRQRLEKA